jgi:hypothetical protein
LNGEGAIAENNLYNFSPEWKQALLEWFYNNQDPETGFWGPRSKTDGRLLKKDLTNTVSVIKTLVDEDGNDVYKDFPLKYRDKVVKTTIEVLAEPMPDDEDLDEFHEWNLKMGRGIKMLTKYLWKDISNEDKKTARKIIENYIKIKFEKNYVASEGSFSYYPNEEHATLDGMGNFFIFDNVGVFSPEKQRELWGKPQETILDLGVFEISKFSEGDPDLLANAEDVNSIRVYTNFPEHNLLENVEMVFYPKEPLVLDIFDLTPRIKKWIYTTPQTMGNWVSKESCLQDLEEIEIKEVAVYDEIPKEELNEILQENSQIIVIGFDILQVPRYTVVFKLKK